VVSADGLPLGTSPATDERRAAAVWARVCSLGRVTRGFVAVDDELWAFNQDDAHGVLVIADPNVRPGVALEMADQVLTAVRPIGGLGGRADAASEARDVRDIRDLKPAGRRLRSALHPETKPAADVSEAGPVPVPVVVSLEPADVRSEASTEAAPDVVAGDATPVAIASDGSDERASEADGLAEESASPKSATGDVDVVALAREFSGLLFDREDGSR
jgi:hypothetical protein